MVTQIPGYQLTLSGINVSDVVFKWHFPVSIRCDDMLSQGFAGAGCVIPSVIPWEAFIASDRLLNRDKFWIAVTA